MQKYKEHEIEWTDEQVSRLWDYYSTTPPYNTMYFTKSYASDILNKASKHIDINDKVVLDFGCGAGYLIDEISSKYSPDKYYALDFSQRSIDIVKNKKLSFKMEPILATQFPCSIPSNSVDICFFIEVIEHLNDKHLKSSLLEIHRILKKDGILIITTPNNELLNDKKVFCPDCGSIFHKWQHQRSWNKGTLNTEMKSFNFKTEIIKEINLKTTRIMVNLVRSLKAIVKRSPPSNLVGIFRK